MHQRAPIKVAQYGVQHGHAAGKAIALRGNPEVDFCGVYESDPDAWQRGQSHRAYNGIHWYGSPREFLDDPTVQAVAIEGLNAQSLPMALEAVEAGQHIWYDKPAGDDWPLFQQVVDTARRKNLVVQMGFMFRYDPGFQRLAEWVRAGLLGEVFGVRAHMSTNIPEAGGPLARQGIGANHLGGILYDLGGHMLDQVLWVMGDERPAKVTAFLRNDASPDAPSFADNTLGVFEFAKGMAMVDIAAMESRPMARRFEVYGTRGSAILDPIDPVSRIRLCLNEARDGFRAGVQFLDLQPTSRQRTYELELQAFLPAIRGERPPDRTLDHELLVQETLLRATGRLPTA